MPKQNYVTVNYTLNRRVLFSALELVRFRDMRVCCKMLSELKISTDAEDVYVAQRLERIDGGYTTSTSPEE